MNKHRINNLEDKFFDANLNPEEEKRLKIYDSGNDNKTLNDYLSTMESLKNEKLPDNDFEDNIIDLINSESNKSKKARQWTSLVGIAASILLIISVWFMFNNNSQTLPGTITDPAIAFSETKTILQEISGKLKEGIDPAKSTIKKVDKGIKNTKSIKKAGETLDNMKKINKLNKTEDLLKSMTKVTVKAG